MEDDKNRGLNAPYEFYYRSDTNCLIARLRAEVFAKTPSFSLFTLVVDDSALTLAGYYDFQLNLSKITDKNEAARFWEDIAKLPFGVTITATSDQLIYLLPKAVYVGKSVVDFCQGWAREKLQYVADAMRMAYNPSASDVRFTVSSDGGFLGSLYPGCSMTLKKDYITTIATEQWHEVLFHHAATAYTKYALFVGIVALCTVVRQSQSKK